MDGRYSRPMESCSKGVKTKVLSCVHGRVGPSKSTAELDEESRARVVRLAWLGLEEQGITYVQSIKI